jgi:hypothetical protein
MISKVRRERMNRRDRTHGLEKYGTLKAQLRQRVSIVRLVRVSICVPVTRTLVLGHLFFVLTYLLLHFAESGIQRG